MRSNKPYEAPSRYRLPTPEHDEIEIEEDVGDGDSFMDGLSPT
jgi:hypothetical protein